MKFKLKINSKLKPRLKTVILLILIILSISSIISVSYNLSKGNQEVENLNTSAAATPKYKYAYENDFDYLSTYQNTPKAYSQEIFVDGDDTEWSQNSTDAEKLQLNYCCIFDPLDWSFIMDGGIVVISHNTFKKQTDPELGAFIKWKLDIDNPYLDKLSYDFILVSLLILEPNNYEELITIESFSLQEDTFYLANFSQYIWSDGRIRFLLRGLVYGHTNQWSGIVITMTFEGLEVVQEIKPVTSEEERTLILVHGFGCETPVSFWGTYRNSLEFKEAYDKIIIMSYYGDYCAYKYSKDEYGDWKDPITYSLGIPETSVWTSINDIAAGLALYIMQDLYYIGDNVDIVCHSMGGLVTRFMIKNYYSAIQSVYEIVGRSFTIHSVCTIGTPNHGVWYGWLVPCTQTLEMAPGSPFITALNYVDIYPGTEIPLSGIDINWFTYRSGIYKEFGVRNDGVVEMDSVPIIGATNKGIYDLDHNSLVSSKMMNHVVFNDVVKTPEIILKIFNEGTPGKIMAIEDLTLDGKTLSIIFPQDVAIDIDPTSVFIEINPTYQMKLKAGTTNTYEVDLPLAPGDYTFLITADALDGSLYQISGNLKILPDITPPIITITSPIDGLITNQDVTLIYTVSDDFSDIADITVIGPASGTIYSSEGNYDITITATDEAGNADSATVSFIIDKTVPSINIYGSTPGYHNTDQIVYWSVLDNNLDPNQVIASHPSGYTFSSDGTYEVIVSATDLAGNSASKSLIFTLDKFAPIITITGPPTGYYNTDQIVIWSVSDDNLDPDQVFASHTSGYTFSTDGTYQVTVTATDLAGNTATASSAEFVIDKTPPVITIEGPPAGYYNTDQTVTWSVSDDNLDPDQVFASHPSGYIFYTDGTYQVTVTATDLAGNTATASSDEFVIDKIMPETSIFYGFQHFIINDNVHLTSTTTIELIPDDILDETFYRIFNDTYNSGLIQYDGIFSLNSLNLFDGIYELGYYSTDDAGNVEDHNYKIIVLDNSPPVLSWLCESCALQDDFLFDIIAEDATGVTDLMVSIQELNGPVVAQIPVTYAGGNHWVSTEMFDTTSIPDGYYELVVFAREMFGFTTTKVFSFSIRNWAIIVLLPSTGENKAGRTMPIKFSLRVAEVVDPNMPFVVNQELDIFITDLTTNEVLQHSIFGDNSKDYRINDNTELYITNFKTHKTPTTYSVSVYRKDFFIDDFEFETVK